MSQNPHLVSVHDLAGLLGRDDIRVLDASWYLPAQHRQALAEYETAHIPGAVFFDQDAVVDPGSALPHTIPAADLFAEALGALGISEDDRIVVYDGLGLFSAPRVWWLLRTFGAEKVQLLDGGFPAWQAAGLPTESGIASPARKSFHARFDASAVVTFEAMRGHVERGDVQIADARPADRFAGTVPEPRPGVRSGHMPGATSLPFGMLAENGRLKSAPDLRAAFAAAGIDPEQDVVTTCGSGVTAAVINLALASVGNKTARLYDGSWSEWGSASDTAVATGPSTPGSRL